MPGPGNRGKVRKMASFRARGRSAHSIDVESLRGGGGVEEVEGTGGGNDARVFLQIRPAIADPRRITTRSHSTLGSESCVTGADGSRQETGSAGGGDGLSLRAVGEGRVQLARTAQERDRLPDRISLDRRGLSSIPHIVGEPGLRLLSLQHNLVSSLVGLAALDVATLVCLDLYDNQIDKISCLERLNSLRVLLLGKNRIRRIEGLSYLSKLEVLDLHGNRISKVSGLSNLAELKVLNLAGNQIKCIGQNDLQGLISLRELNLKRNRLKKLMGFVSTPKLQKLFLSNNDLQSVDDMSSLALSGGLREVTLDGNPVALGGDCTPFLVSYLPSLTTLTGMHVTEQVRRAAMAWRHNKEAAHAAYCALGGSAQQAARRDQVINNARTNWELLRTENKCFATGSITMKQPELDKEFVLQATSATIPHADTTTLDIAALPDTIVVHSAGNAVNNIDPTASDNTGTAAENQKQTMNKKLQRSSTARKSADRRVNFSERSASQDTDASHSTSTSSDLRLPPILVPIISSLENVKLSETGEPLLKRWESISSVDPVVDSSLSSLPSSSSDSEEEENKKILRRVPTALRRRANFSTVRSKSVCDPESRRSKSVTKPVTQSDNSENASNISTSTNVGSAITNSSTSGSEHNQRVLRRDGSLNSRLSNRNIKSATISRRSEHSSLSRASTGRAKSGKNIANLKSSEPVSKGILAPKDREQGVDYLVEVRGSCVSVWGGGAVRQLEREWEWESAVHVTTAAFHYVHYNSVAQALPRLKNKFPNVTHVLVRATGLQWLGQLHALAELRGLRGLTVVDEGNPIDGKQWRQYAIYRLTHWGLNEINGEPINENEVADANATYAGLSEMVVRALPDAPLQPLLSRLGRGAGAGGAKAWLRAADPALRDVVAKEALQWKRGNVSQEEASWRVRGRSQLSHCVELACGAAQRLRMLELEWPSLLTHLVEEALRDFADMRGHVDAHMRRLNEEQFPN